MAKSDGSWEDRYESPPHTPLRSDMGTSSGGSHFTERKPAPKVVVEYTKPPQWPTRPQRLAGSGLRGAVWGRVGDVVLMIKASIFLVICGLAVSLHGKPTTAPLGAVLEQLAKLGPTLFPIVFAALAGRSLKHIARYKAETGIQLSNLWTLVNSRTLWDVTWLPFHLGRASMLAMNLSLLWLLSPLGGQASLRLLYAAPADAPTAGLPLRYLDTGPLGHVRAGEAVITAGRVAAATGGDGLPVGVPAAFSAALMQSARQKAAGADAWGNVKVPRVDRLDASKADVNGWIAVGNGGNDGAARPERFAALIGLPVVGLPTESKDIVSFAFEATHLSLACDPLGLYSFADIPGSKNLSFGLDITCPDCVRPDDVFNAAIFASRSMAFLGVPVNQSRKVQPGEGSSSTPPRTVQIMAGIGDARRALRAECAVTHHAVEVEAQCDTSATPACRPVRARRSRSYGVGANLTPLDYWAAVVLDAVSAASQPSAAVRNASTSWFSPAERFLADSSRLPAAGFLDGAVDLTKVPSDVFADRATMLLNTFMQLLMAPVSLAGVVDAADLSIFGPAHSPFNGTLAAAPASFWTSQFSPGAGALPPSVSSVPFLAAAALGAATPSVQVFRVAWPWLAVLLVASSALVSLGATGLYLSGRTLAPDVFDPVAALTCDNPYIRVAADGSTLSAGERLRLLGDVRVAVGDVQGQEEVGRVALGLAGNVEKLDRRRLYE